MCYVLRHKYRASPQCKLGRLRPAPLFSVQTGCFGVQGSTRRCSTLPLSADPFRRLAWSTNTPFYQGQPPRGTSRQTVNSRQPSLCGCGCGSTHLEYTLPTVVAANSLSTFRRLLKRFLVKQSYPDIIYWYHPASGPCSGCST